MNHLRINRIAASVTSRFRGTSRIHHCLLAIVTSLAFTMAFAGPPEQALTISPNGRVAIGGSVNAEPVAPLDIGQSSRTGTNHPDSVGGLYVTGNFQPAQGVEFRHDNGTQGIGIGYNTLYATGSRSDQDLNLKPQNEGKVNVQGPLTVKGPVSVEGALSAPGLMIGSVSEFRSSNSQVYRSCRSTGAGECTVARHAACANGATPQEYFHSYCTIWFEQPPTDNGLHHGSNQGYCHHYFCYSK